MNRSGVLLDTGPLVALLHRSDAHHTRAKALLASCEAPLRTCEAVLAEAAHLLSRIDPRAPASVLALGRAGAYEIGLRLDEHWASIERTIAKYRNLPASLADASLIRCAEVHGEARIVTFDAHFRVYRWGRNRGFEIVA